MADSSTFITGIGPGVLGNAIRTELPPWATETTLARINGTLIKSLKIQTDILDALKSGGKGVDPDRAYQEYDKKRKRRDKEEDDRAKQKALDAERDKNLSKTQRVWDERTLTLKKLLTDSEFKLAFTTGLVEAAFGKMMTTMVKNTESFDSLYKAGVSVMDSTDSAAGGFDAIRGMVARTGIDLKELSNILIGSAGANAVGAQTFTRALGMSSSKLTAFGFNAEESGELMGVYLDSLVGLGAAQRQNKETIADGTVAFGDSMSKLSLMSGISMKKLQEQTIAISSSIDANVIAAEKGTHAALMASQVIASFKNADLGKAIMGMMSSKIPILDKTFQNFVSAGMGAFGQKLMAHSKSLIGLAPDDAIRVKKKFLDSLGNIDQMIAEQRYLAEANVQGAAENLQVLLGLKQERETLKDLDVEAIARERRTAESLKKLQKEWTSLMATFSKLFAPIGPLMEAVAWGLRQFNDMVGAVLDTPILGTAISWFATALVGLSMAFVTVRASMMFFTTLFPVVAGPMLSFGKAIWAGVGIMGRLTTMLGSLAFTVGRLLLPVVTSMGTALLPIVVGMAKFVSPLLTGIGMLARTLAVAALSVGAPILAIVGSIVAVGSLIYMFRDEIAAVTDYLWEGLKTIVSSAAKGFVAALSFMVDVITAPYRMVVKMVAGIWDTVVGSLSGIIDDIGSYISDSITGLWDKMTSPFTMLGDWVKDTWIGRTLFGGDDKESQKVSAAGNTKPNPDQIPAAIPNNTVAAANVTIESPTHTEIRSPDMTAVGSTPFTAEEKAQHKNLTEADIQAEKATATSRTDSAITAQTGGSVENNSGTLAEINNTLAYQSALLDQLVDGIKGLLSVNRDILKYTKIQ